MLRILGICALLITATVPLAAQTVDPDTFPIRCRRLCGRSGVSVQIWPAVLQATTLYAQWQLSESKRPGDWSTLGAATCLLVRREDGEPEIVVQREGDARPNCTVRREKP